MCLSGIVTTVIEVQMLPHMGSVTTMCSYGLWDGMEDDRYASQSTRPVCKAMCGYLRHMGCRSVI